MPRSLRVEYPGAVYHLLNRGDRRQDIFGDEDDRLRFLVALGEAGGKTEWQAQAYCLMRHHFHRVVETPQPNLVAGVKWLLGVYSSQGRAGGPPPKGNNDDFKVDGDSMEDGCLDVCVQPVE